MTTLTITRGLPGSGKSTWALSQIKGRERDIVRVNRDNLRRMLHGEPQYSYVTELAVTHAQKSSVARLLQAGISVIVDDTNLKARWVREWRALADNLSVDFVVKDFTAVTLATCIARDLQRPDDARVGEGVIQRMYNQYIKGRDLPLPLPRVEIAIEPARMYYGKYNAPRAVMVDIDGTLALHGDRDPYDTSRYHEDTVNQPVVEAVRAMQDAGHVVILCSGRDERFRAVTEAWLTDKIGLVYGLWHDGLYMRPEGDRRRDNIVKLELFDAHIRDNYNVTCVFDDRDRVVQAWRSIGLTVFQVAPGNF